MHPEVVERGEVFGAHVTAVGHHLLVGLGVLQEGVQVREGRHARLQDAPVNLERTEI